MPDARYTVPQAPGQPVTRQLRQPLYDTTSYEAAGNALMFFQVPQGQQTLFAGAQVVKTLWHTNMRLAGQISTPNTFLLAGFRVEIMVGSFEVTHIAIYRWGVFQFFFGNNAWLQIPLSQIPQGVGMSGYGGQINRPVQGSSAPIMYEFRITGGDRGFQPILPGESFSATITFPAGLVAAYEATWVRVYLLGILQNQL